MLTFNVISRIKYDEEIKQRYFCQTNYKYTAYATKHNVFDVLLSYVTNKNKIKVSRKFEIM